MFDALSDRLEVVFRRLKGRGRLSEDQVNEALAEIRVALLEADVHTQAVRDFLRRVRERAVGEEVRKALTPAQQVIKIVHDELVGILGGKAAPLQLAQKPPTVIMLAGLQGSGKTTAAGKLATHLRSKGKQPLLVACDLRRPAAVEQLQLLGEQAGVPVVAPNGARDPVGVAAKGLEEAERVGRDVVIVDTAGRLHVDEEMMAEAAAIRERIRPTETLLVVDAMTGQDAVNVATSFLEHVDFSGIVLTKLDGDARGGAALSIAHVSGRPVKFASTGERLDAFEPFHPDRMASRILGMGDMLTLIEKAEGAYEEEQRAEMEEKLLTAAFTLEDFLEQMRQLRKMGPISNLLGMIPGMKGALKDVEFDERDLGRTEAIIHSMTAAERQHPDLIDGGRRLRIARGCGMTTGDVNALIKQFDAAKKMMRAMAGGGGMPSLPRGMTVPGGVPRVGGAPSRPKPKDRHRPRKQHGKKKKRRR
jgi:signal recognition particle subunit SRP54